MPFKWMSIVSSTVNIVWSLKGDESIKCIFNRLTTFKVDKIEIPNICNEDFWVVESMWWQDHKIYCQIFQSASKSLRNQYFDTTKNKKITIHSNFTLNQTLGK